jgi:3-dehydroquinate synthase
MGRRPAAYLWESQTLENQTTVHVNLSERSYDIGIGSGNLKDVGRFIAELGEITHAVVITDTNVRGPHGGRCVDSLVEAGLRVEMEVIEAGEESKSVANANHLWQRLLEHGTDRKSVVVAAGGGVIGDLAGFVAATYARGVGLVQVPTTLLAHVDSSVGGKVAVNLPGAKNMVGAFWQPLGVMIDTQVLDTLPIREYRAGLAEVVKYGVILDADFFAFLEEHVEEINGRDAEVLRYVIARCCRLKADVVENDERETTGLRAVLNYGHTFAHAIEAEAGYGEFLHGEAVSIGMIAASRLAERMGRVDSQLTRRQHDLLIRLGLPVELPDLSPDLLVAAMGRDKKVAHGRLRFVLPTRLGHVELVSDVPDEYVHAVLR